MPTLAEALAAFALRSYAAGLPNAIFRQGRRAFVNWIGCAYGGCDDPADAMVHHPAVAALRRCVRLAPADAARCEARAAVTLRDGRRIEAHVRDCRGSARRPMTDPEIGRKFFAGSFARRLSTV
jgi:hypothetical protein